MRIRISSTASHHVLLSKKYTYMRQRSQVYAGAPKRSRMVLHSRLMFWYWHLAGFWCCWCSSLCQVVMCKGQRTCLTRSLISTCAQSLMSLVGAPHWVMLSRSVLTNCLSEQLDRIHICSVGLSTNKELSRGNATIDHRSVGVDGIGSHWFIMRTHVQGRIQRLVSFLEYSTHGHACKKCSSPWFQKPMCYSSLPWLLL
jgi:hypothetical protein